MYLLGLTGSIAMGKSETARMLRRLKVPVSDSDAIVHRLFARGGALVGPVEALFPGVTVAGAVDRMRLGMMVLSDDRRMKALEALVHPAVRKVQAEEIARAARRGARVCVLDIPLLYETKGEGRVDAVMVVSAPACVQRARALRRPTMNKLKFQAILARQVPDREKRRRADFVLPTGLGRRPTWLALCAVIDQVKRRRGRRWVPGAASAMRYPAKGNSHA